MAQIDTRTLKIATTPKHTFRILQDRVAQVYGKKERTIARHAVEIATRTKEIIPVNQRSRITRATPN